jgi:hypothetical protein
MRGLAQGPGSPSLAGKAKEKVALPSLCRCPGDFFVTAVLTLPHIAPYSTKLILKTENLKLKTEKILDTQLEWD